MNNVTNNASDITNLLEKLKNCHRIQFRVDQDFRAEMRKLLCRASYRVDGFTFNDVARACLLYGLDAFLRLDVDVATKELLTWIKESKRKPGRPLGSTNLLFQDG